MITASIAGLFVILFSIVMLRDRRAKSLNPGSCKLHENCNAAEATFRQRKQHGDLPANAHLTHCWAEDCESCFGK